MNFRRFNIKHVIVLAFALSASAHFSYSKDIISHRYIAGYEYKQLSDEIETANDISFELKDKQAVGKWDVLYLGYDGEYHSIYEVRGGAKRPESDSNSVFFMRMGFLNYEPTIPKNLAAKVFTNEEKPLHYMIKVTCQVSNPEENRIDSDTVFLRLGLPLYKPSKPEILEMRYENIIYDWELDCMLDSEFTIGLRCEGAAVCELRYNSQSSFTNSEDVCLNNIQLIHFDNNYYAHFKFGGADWGTVMKFIGYNEFGKGEDSGRYFTTDYIDDPEILARIEELKNIANGLGDTKQVKIPISDSISVTDEYVYCTGAISNLDLYDMSGNLLSSVNGVGLIRTDNLPHGVYVLNASSR